jgi:hypothetical protein
MITFLNVFSEMDSDSARQSLSTGQEHEGSDNEEGTEDAVSLSVSLLTVKAVSLSVVALEYPCSLLIKEHSID